MLYENGLGAVIFYIVKYLEREKERVWERERDILKMWEIVRERVSEKRRECVYICFCKSERERDRNRVKRERENRYIYIPWLLLLVLLLLLLVLFSVLHIWPDEYFNSWMYIYAYIYVYIGIYYINIQT